MAQGVYVILWPLCNIRGRSTWQKHQAKQLTFNDFWSNCIADQDFTWARRAK